MWVDIYSSQGLMNAKIFSSPKVIWSYNSCGDKRVKFVGAINHCSPHESLRYNQVSLIPFLTVSSAHHLSLVWTPIIVPNEFPNLFLLCFKLKQHFAIPRCSCRHGIPATYTLTQTHPVVLISWYVGSRFLAQVISAAHV